MSRISEFEPRRRKVDDREEGRRSRRPRRSWPASAWFVAGTMIALNLALGAFVVKNEMGRGTFRGEQHGPVGVAPSIKPTSPVPFAPIVEAPKVEPQADARTSQSPLPDQSSKRDVVSAPAAKNEDRNTRAQNREASHPQLKTGAAQTRTTQASKAGPGRYAAESNKWAAIRQDSPVRSYQPEPYPQARYTAPQTYPSQPSAADSNAVRSPASSSDSGAADNSTALVASVRTPAVGAPSPTDSPRKVTPLAATGTAAKKAQPALDLKADQTQKQPVRVASVGLPRMDKGLIVPKTPVGTPSPVIEVVRRPQGPKVEVENCGGDKVIPCPTLHKRPLGGAPEGARW